MPTFESSKANLPVIVGTKVRFRESALSRMEPKLRKRLTNRVGEVTGYRTGANAPIVHFARIGKFQQFLLCDVDVGSLELLNE
jgi:hypothetical protein